jgi:hypothetical protein
MNAPCVESAASDGDDDALDGRLGLEEHAPSLELAVEPAGSKPLGPSQRVTSLESCLGVSLS